MFPRLPVVVALLALSLVGTAGCSEDSSSSTSANEPEVVTVVKTVAAAEPEPAAEAPAKDEVAAAAVEEEQPDGIRVPDVVGEDHQLAQDTMQAAGLYNLAEEDATGQGRMLLVDRNWTVVSQSPAAGSVVADDKTITLRSKKDGE